MKRISYLRKYTCLLYFVASSLLLPSLSYAKDTPKLPYQSSTKDPYITALREDVKNVSDSELQNLVNKLSDNSKSQLEVVAEISAEDPDRFLLLLLAGLERRPENSAIWYNLITMKCSVPDSDILRESFHPYRGRDYYQKRRACLKMALDTAETKCMEHSSKDAGNENLVMLQTLRYGLAKCYLVLSEDLKPAKQLAEQMLRTNTDPNSWDYDNVIHKSNTVLGHIAIREDNLEQAKSNLLASATVKGSPQLNSFGPSFTLASELLQKGEKETVVKYLDLVAGFWAKIYPENNPRHKYNNSSKKHAEKLVQWKEQIEEGKIPDDRKWGSQKGTSFVK